MKIVKLSAAAVADGSSGQARNSRVSSTAAALLKKGGVIICPTDTVYGFLADASNKKAVDNIYNIKKRPKSKPLSLFVKDIKMANEVAFIDENQTKLLKKYWPGKYTFIIKRKTKSEKRNIFGVKKSTVAIRIPNHTFLHQILKKINRPIIQTSANISGEGVLDKIDDIIKQFGKSNILIIDGGDIKKGKPSKIIDLTNKKNKILRS